MMEVSCDFSVEGDRADDVCRDTHIFDRLCELFVLGKIAGVLYAAVKLLRGCWSVKVEDPVMDWELDLEVVLVDGAWALCRRGIKTVH